MLRKLFGLCRVHGYTARVSVSRHKTVKAEKENPNTAVTSEGRCHVSRGKGS